ncbi:MAG: bifunctional UDP-sugar hydrolase/5'-nucleotidase [bacterium]|nr:bifunctional UDP-sugar hydrolase/5'-nucleotidase [bacterium]
MRYISLLLVVMVGSIGCRNRPQPLTIFHTNDIHGHFTAEVVSWRDDSVKVGGMAALSDDLDSLRHVYPKSLYLDAGDLMTGNPICRIAYRGVEGGALLEMLHRCGVSAIALGNHELDQGADHLRRFVRQAPFPILCANIRDAESDSLLADSARIFRVGNVRVGVIGLMMDQLAGSVAKASMIPFHVDSVVEAAQNQINELDPKTDVIILLTHQGVDEDSLLATRVHGADVIVGGHSHTRLESPLRVNGIVIVQAGAYGKNLGVLDLTVAGDSVQECRGSLIELAERTPHMDSPVRQLADSLDAVIQEIYGEVIGRLAAPWKPSYYETSNVGNWITDRLRERYQADVAFVNAGGIRAGLEAGPVTLLDVQQMLPFMNSIVTLEARGADLQRTALEQSRAQGLRRHGALEMSGMTVSFELAGVDDSVSVGDVRIGGQPIDMSRRYRVVTIDYVAQGHEDRYLGFTPQDVESTGDLISDVIAEEIRSVKQPIRADDVVRLRDLP